MEVDPGMMSVELDWISEQNGETGTEPVGYVIFRDEGARKAYFVIKLSDDIQGMPLPNILTIENSEGQQKYAVNSAYCFKQIQDPGLESAQQFKEWAYEQLGIEGSGGAEFIVQEGYEQGFPGEGW